VDEFEAYAKVGTHELVAEAEGSVQDETEGVLLTRLAEQILALDQRLGAGELLVVDNDQGNDWPKTRQKTSNVVVEGENRLHFQYSIAPALRVTVWRRAR
jgi:hypothetical protein